MNNILSDLHKAKIKEFNAIGYNYNPQTFSGLLECFRKKDNLKFINFADWLKREEDINLYDVLIDSIFNSKKIIISNDFVTLMHTALKYSSYSLRKLEPIVFDYLTPISKVVRGGEANMLFKLYKQYKDLDEEKMNTVLSFLEKWNSLEPFDHLKQESIKKFIYKSHPEIIKKYDERINTLLPDYDAASLIEGKDSYSYSIKMSGNKIGKLAGKPFKSFSTIFSSNLYFIMKELSENKLFLNNEYYKIEKFNFSKDLNYEIEGTFLFTNEEHKNHFKMIFSVIINNLIKEQKNQNTFVLDYHIKAIEEVQLLDSTKHLIKSNNAKKPKL